MADDGNCMFRAVADQIAGDEEKYAVFRKNCIKYILENKDDYIPFMEEGVTIDQYCKKMGKDCVWGGNIEMNALGKHYKFNAIIH